MFRLILLFLFFLPIAAWSQELAVAPNSQTAKSKPVRKDRVWIRDLEGTWISKAYLDKLQALHSPRAAARAAPPTAIKIRKDGNSYPILITNFRRAVQNVVIEVEPSEKSDSYRLVTAEQDGMVSSSEVTYIDFRGTRNAQGVFDHLSFAEPHFTKSKPRLYVRLDSGFEAVINRATVAGKYLDAEGKQHEFTEGGEATTPEGKFAYEVSLDPADGSCDMLQPHSEREPEGKQRLGFKWKGEQLELFRVSGEGKQSRCADKPFTVLSRQS